MEEKKEKRRKALKRVLIGAGIVGLCVEASRDFKEMKKVGDVAINIGTKIADGAKSIFKKDNCSCECEQEERTFQQNQNWKGNRKN